MKKCIVKLISINLILVLMLSLSGCGKKKNPSADSEKISANSVNLYYHDGYEIKISEEKYQLKQPDKLSSAVEELIGALASNMERAGCETSVFMLDSEDVLKLTVKLKTDLASEDVLLIKACICNTLFQLEALSGIELIIEDKDENVISDEDYTRETFYFYEK